MSTYIVSRISTVKPFLSAFIAMVAAGLLIVMEHLRVTIEPQVETVLWVILIATLCVTILQIARSEKVFSRHLAQLGSQRERLANEIKYRLWAEKTSSENKTKLQIVDENFPVMLAYFNREQQCCYHNRAFRQWFGLRPEQIDGRFLHECLSESFYLGVKSFLDSLLAGETLQNQHTQQMANRSTCLVTGQFVPHFDTNGEVIGFYALYTPRLLKEGERIVATGDTFSATAANANLEKKSIRNPSISQSTHQQKKSSLSSSERILRAIEQEAFHLHAQKIIPVQKDHAHEVYYEILIRMAEEESNMIPPGAFLPMVEKYNLLPRLDRWVVGKSIDWLKNHAVEVNVSLCINVAKSTLEDKMFVVFIQERLNTVKIEPHKLCFEIEAADAAANLPGCAIFARNVKSLGCQVSLCGFDYNRESLHLLKNIKADFIKINGSLICNILRNAEDLKKVSDINRFSHTQKIKTIGELVETPEVLAKLTEIGVDYAQGFGIDRPHPLDSVQ
ncbi:MAG: EAL domain-containing protein [Nitrosomonas sp.]|nr:EAL domain-containing protein [Nitrosomonas sp.]